MNKQLLTLALLLLVLLTTGFAQQLPKPQQWEYKTLVKCDEKKLNALGSEGWELTGFSQWPAGLSTVDTCIFKRPRS